VYSPFETRVKAECFYFCLKGVVTKTTNYSSLTRGTDFAGRTKSLVVSLAALKPVFAKSQEIAELSKHFVMVNVEVS